jgi:hypothetical protein
MNDSKSTLTGGTRLLKGFGGKIGSIIRRMIKAEDKNERRASVRARMSGMIILIVVRNG